MERATDYRPSKHAYEHTPHHDDTNDLFNTAHQEIDAVNKYLESLEDREFDVAQYVKSTEPTTTFRIAAKEMRIIPVYECNDYFTKHLGIMVGDKLNFDVVELDGELAIFLTENYHVNDHRFNFGSSGKVLTTSLIFGTIAARWLMKVGFNSVAVKPSQYLDPKELTTTSVDKLAGQIAKSEFPIEVGFRAVRSTLKDFHYLTAAKWERIFDSVDYDPAREIFDEHAFIHTSRISSMDPKVLQQKEKYFTARGAFAVNVLADV